MDYYGVLLSKKLNGKGTDPYDCLFAKYLNGGGEEYLWSFSNGYALSKGNVSGQTAYRKIWRASVSARACGSEPIENKNYVFTVTDSSKYNLAAYDITNLTKITEGVPAASVDGYMYQGGTKSISWKTSDSVSSTYVWLSLKKNDGTDFTADELKDGAKAVFTYTSS